MPTPAGDPIALLLASGTLDVSDREKLDAGEPVVKVLPAEDHDLTIFTAIRVNIDGERLIGWMRQIEAWQRGRYVPAVARFSTPPRIGDLNGLVLDDRDLKDIRQCRSGDCGLKLSTREMTYLRGVADDAGSGWKGALQEAFREVILARVRDYQLAGYTELAAYHDHDRAVLLSDEFARIVRPSTFPLFHSARLATYLLEYPNVEEPEFETLFYWSQETLGSKPIISITQTSIFRNDDLRLPEVLVASKQIFATHYLTASLAVTALTRGQHGATRYLLYLNRSRLDMLRGMFGGLVRGIVERRIRAEAPTVLQGLRDRLESGDPPPAAPPLSEAIVRSMPASSK